ncbi:circularly permutated Ras protein 1 [Corythoichthys intestinalis]|uniref:circularly permutated Ras protein 1 n=1 Tax=Corythoichthys intestinalis TaxID=161448 RepID=UPI0025A6035A|nr:circularly permutated Ras protein 1 [Corythoichthys intestinalis]XP_057681635.1 circularly permutated Ras protein 1 [Corythoichthys intestinalis]XP_057681636.1 circularly permutated Ras protein 1 [Corythoichthys intestinalis]XP_061807726.1 circularly permutated Ras protein 1-like [Nerophis lumbriciformis]
MEFACDFVYVSPPAAPKDNSQVFKRSALLPPVNWIRPAAAPPPPPVKSDESCPKVGEWPDKSRQQGMAGSRSHHYDNAYLEQQSSKRLIPTRKTALLPPHLTSASNSRSPSPNQTADKFIYDNVRPESLEGHSTPDIPDGTGLDANSSGHTAPSAPPLPPRPSFLKNMPEYLDLLPASSSHEETIICPTSAPPPPAPADDSRPLQGNPNVILVSLGKLLLEKVQCTQGKPTSCSQCGAVLYSAYDNAINGCYFCEQGALSVGLEHGLFLLRPPKKLLSNSQPLLIFCIDISASMSITSQVSTGEHFIHRSRLEFVQEAVLLCVKKLSRKQPDTPVGLITFNYEVTVHGYGDFPSLVLQADELIDSDNLKAAASAFATPPPLSSTKDFLEQQVTSLSAEGTTALGPAALVAITMASRHPGSKVIICTDGKANTTLGNLEVEDNDARTLLSSTIFYQKLGERAAHQGVTVSVLSIEGTDCRLDELGQLADRTGGKVVIANPRMLQSEFEQIIDNNTIATQCTVSLILPKSLRMRGEKEAGHKTCRKVGNVHPDEEITFQFMADEAEVLSPALVSTVSIQLQLRYTLKNGQRMLQVFTATRNVTNERLVALSCLSLPIIQLNSSQASAALAVRGRFLDARRESEQQMKLIKRVVEHNRSAEDRQTYKEWVDTMEPLYNNFHNFTRAKSVVSDSQSLTDAGAALLYAMKQSNRKTIMIKNQQNLHFSPHWKQSKD